MNGPDRYSRGRSSWTVGSATVLLSVIVFFNSQILSGVWSNPIGIKGVQELFYAYLVGSTFFWIFSRRANYIDITVFLIVFVAFIWSATAATIRFGQPFHIGLVENRKLLAVLVYFPLVRLLRSGRVDYHQLERGTVRMAVVCAIISIGVYLGIVPTLHALDLKENTLRGLRIAIGQGFIAVSIVILLAPLSKMRYRLRWQTVALLGFVLLFIIQTRQLIAIAVAGLFFIGGRARWAIIAVVAAVIILTLSGSTLPVIDRFNALFSAALNDDYVSTSWRALSITTIMADFRAGNLLGSGGLYIGWDDGFQAVYGPYFYLADVGLFGSLYRYGLLVFVLYGAYFGLQAFLIFRIQEKPYRRLFGVIFLMLLIASPFGAPLEVRGHIVGFLLASSASFARLPKRRRSRGALSGGAA